MYVWQMNDGSWNISIMTSADIRGLSSAIYANREASRLYTRGYQTEAEARTAERTIRELVAV